MEISNILTVDDDPQMLKILAGALKADGHQVISAESGKEALKKLDVFTPELIIADVMMPEMDGYELCRKVRSNGYDDIPFIFCSALGKLPERIKGLWLGADDYIVKPIDAEELRLKVKRLLEKSRKLRIIADVAKDVKSDCIMSGNLGDVETPDILQLLNQLEPIHACFLIITPKNVIGEIYIAKREIIHAQIGEITGMKAFCRILGCKQGTYRVEKRNWAKKPTISGGLEEVLFKGITQVDEYNHLRKAVEKKGSSYRIKYDSFTLLRQFDDKIAELLRIIETRRELDNILDHSPYTDLETLRIIMEVITTGAVKVERKNI